MDVLALFIVFNGRQLDLFSLNFGEIILLSKVNEVEMVQQYRPICLLKVRLK
jgi:hypothetical protein